MIMQTALGYLRVISRHSVVVQISFVETAPLDLPARCAVEQEAAQQLRQYFDGLRQQFTFSIEENGTPFEKRVWQCLRTIPYGQTVSYGAVARRIGCPRAARAVGAACRRNPLAIVTPCHRVIAADQSLNGYAYGLERKKYLLQLEQAAFVDETALL